MNDDVKAALARFRKWEFEDRAGWTIEDGESDHRALLAHIDGEDARTAAAVAAAREEQREACAQAADDFSPRNETDDGVANAVRATPLTATPLADELERSWQETARMVERAEKAEAERDALKRELADLIPLAESAMRQANNDGAEYDIKAELADARRVAEANMQTAERASQSIDAVMAERDALAASLRQANENLARASADCLRDTEVLRAQVEAARAVCADFDVGGGLMWPGEVLAAMDGAKP